MKRIFSGIASAAIIIASAFGANAVAPALDNLELRVNGANIITGFSPDVTEYTLPAYNSAVMAALHAVPADSKVLVDINVNGVDFTNHSLAPLKRGNNTVSYTVSTPGGESRTYTLNFEPGDDFSSLTGDVHELSIYQIMVASFMHGEGGTVGYNDLWGPEGHRTNGNLRGIIESLDYIKDLGMNAIWMTPIFDSTNGTGGEKLQATGYFATNHFRIDPKFGTEAEFDELIAEAHKRGIYVILDGVFGHHGGANNPSPQGNTIKTVDNTPNVRGTEAGNIVYPESLPYFKEVIRYWTARGVDGWRLDQCYQVYQGGHNYWHDLRLELESIAAERKAAGEQWGTLAYMVGEDWAWPDGITTTKQDGLKSVMDFAGRSTILPGVAKDIADYLANTPQSRGYDEGVVPAAFFTNHDMLRSADFLSSTEMKMRHAALAAYNGPSIVYYNDEIAAKSGNGNEDNKGRVSGRITGFNAEEQDLHDYVASCFKARSENPALWRGTSTVTSLNGGSTQILTKTDAETGNKVACIFSDINTTVNIGGSGLNLMTGEQTSGRVSVNAQVPVFVKMD